MRYLVTAAAAAMLSAGAAQAAVYQYDITMELTQLDLDNGTYMGTGGVPGWLAGEDCNVDSTGDFICDLQTFDARDNRLDTPRLEQFDQSLAAQVTLDTRYNLFNPVAEYDPVCKSTVSFICQGVTSGENFRFTADANGFISEIFQPNAIRQLSSDEFYFVDDASYGGNVDLDTYFFNSGGGMTLSYKTISLEITEIAPVPLPASLPLLGVALGAIGLAARRRSKRAATA